MQKGVLLITDSYRNSVNGISVFSSFFIEDVLQPHFANVIVLETTTQQLYCIDFDSSLLPGIDIETIYVNANFSLSDFFVRKPDFKNAVDRFGLRISKTSTLIMISHGWVKISFRFNYYGIYYWFKNYLRAKDLSRLSFYDQVLFISQASDNFRHRDYKYCIENKIKTSFYDFSTHFIVKTRIKNVAEGTGEFRPVLDNYILLIANFEKIKNLWWIIFYNIRSRFFSKRAMKHFVVLVKPKDSMMYMLFQRLAKLLSVVLVNDQSQKFPLLKNCSYLLITSYSEYNPIVALEAVSFNKKVVSVYKIQALVKRNFYHHLFS